MTRLTFGSLFTGIGGLDLAATWAGFDVVWQVEKDEGLHGILKRHWPGAKRFGDVRRIGGRELATVDLVAGGPPCQPFSVAGQRRGTADDRHLWPEMLRLIRALRPRAVLFENVPGSVDLVLAEVLSDLDGAGYSRHEALSIPAAAVGAPHRRYRIFVVAYADRVRQPQPDGRVGQVEQRPEYGSEVVAQPDSGGCGERVEQSRPERSTTPQCTGTQDLGDPVGAGLEERQGIGRNPEPEQPPAQRTGNLDRERRAQSGLGGMPDGFSAWLDGTNWPAAPGQPQRPWEPPRIAAGVADRTARLRALGNAVSPVVAYPLMRTIARQLSENWPITAD